MIFLYKLVYDCFPFLDLRTKKTKCIFLFDKKKEKNPYIFINWLQILP